MSFAIEIAIRIEVRYKDTVLDALILNKIWSKSNQVGSMTNIDTTPKE